MGNSFQHISLKKIVVPDWEYGDRLKNKKTGALVFFERYYITGLFYYKNKSQGNIIGKYDRFELYEKAVPLKNLVCL